MFLKVTYIIIKQSSFKERKGVVKMSERQWLKEKRLSKNKTQSQVAKLSGISRSYYTNIEAGVKTPAVPVAKRIAEILDFDWTYFFNTECSLEEQNKTA